MSLLLLQLGLCAVSVIQLTSSQNTPEADVIQQDNYVNSTQELQVVRSLGSYNLISIDHLDV